MPRKQPRRARARAMPELWTVVDAYIDETVVHEDDALRAATAAAKDAGIPAIAVAPNQGKLLYLLALLCNARNILEIGTLAGYSTIWLARAVRARGADAGRVITLEYEPQHAEVARANLARAKLGEIVDIRVGKALDTLPAVAPHKPFDLVFIDADKPNIPEYFDWALRLSRPGSVIVVDNVIRDGAVIDAKSKDANVQGVRRLNERLKTERRVSTTTLQTVGSKGYDGFTMALVLE